MCNRGVVRAVSLITLPDFHPLWFLSPIRIQGIPGFATEAVLLRLLHLHHTVGTAVGMHAVACTEFVRVVELGLGRGLFRQWQPVLAYLVASMLCVAVGLWLCRIGTVGWLYELLHERHVELVRVTFVPGVSNHGIRRGWVCCQTL